MYFGGFGTPSVSPVRKSVSVCVSASSLARPTHSIARGSADSVSAELRKRANARDHSWHLRWVGVGWGGVGVGAGRGGGG